MTQKKVTSILSIFDIEVKSSENENRNIIEENKYSNDIECFFDYDNNLNNRITAFKKLNNNSKLQTHEIISDLCTTFTFSPIESILQTMKALLYLDELDISIRLILCTCIYNVEETKDISYELFLYLLDQMKSKKDQYNSTLYLDILKHVINKQYKLFEKKLEQIKDICNFMCNYCDDNNYKNQIYKSIYTMYKDDKYHKNILIYCMDSIKNNCEDRLKIIIINNLHNIIKETNYKEADLAKELINIVNKNTDENTKADVADLLLRFNDNEFKQQGTSILSSIEGVKGKRNFYENSQNIHQINVDTNLQDFINFLSTYQSLVIIKGTDEELYQKSKEELCLITKNDNKISQSLNRIYLDPALYNGFSILTIYIKVWLIIQSHTNKEELLKRLIEELIDMSDTCSTGHLLRLSNVFSGFGFILKMDIQKEMRSKISHLINKKLQRETDDDQIDLIDNMTNQEDMNKFCKFFMKNIENIKEEVTKDYKDILDKDEFEELFRKELVFFETNGKL